jgi:hypothetical protein
MGVQMLARRPATAVTDPPFRLTVSSLALRGFAIADWIIAPVPPGGKGAVELNSTGRSLFGPRSGNGNPCYRIKIPCSHH